MRKITEIKNICEQSSFHPICSKEQNHHFLAWSGIYVLRHPPGLLPLTAVRCSEREVFITFEIWIFILQKRMDSLQWAFIHPLEPCEGCFITVRVLYFKSSEQDLANTRLVPL